MNKILLTVFLLLPGMAVAGEYDSYDGRTLMDMTVAVPYDLLPQRYFNDELDIRLIQSKIANMSRESVCRIGAADYTVSETLNISTTDYGQLEKLLENDGNVDADSIVITGYLNAIDLKALYNWFMERNSGDVLNIEGTVLEDNEIPPYAFYDTSQFDNNRWFPVRRIILPEGVEKIGKAAFACMKVEKINIPSTVREIGSSAFAYDRWLNCDLVIPDGVTAIASQAFIDCYRMEKAPQLPSSLRHIGDFAFAYNRWPEINLPDGLESIGQGAFTGCWMQSLRLPESCLSIDEVAFQGCQELADVSLPKLLETIPYGMLGNCYSLRSIKLPEGCRKVGKSAFFYDPLETVVFGDRVETISKDAFLGCRITTMRLPASLQSLGDACFQDNNLMEVHCMAEVPPVCEEMEGQSGNPFWYDSQPNRAILYVPEGTRRAYANATGWKSFSVIMESSSGPQTEATNYFSKEGVNWIVVEKPGGDDSHTDNIHDIRMKGHLNIAGRDCMMIVREVEDGEHIPIGEISTEGEKVFFYDGMKDEWLLMYDFGLQSGEGCIIHGTNGLMMTNHSDHPRYMVQCLSVEAIPDTELEMMTLNIWPYDINGGLEDLTYEIQWIRGLGSTVCPYDNDSPFRGGNDTFVMEVTLDDRVLYHNDTADVSMAPAASEEDSTIYDILGRRVTAPEAGHIYIRDGRKILWK